jgi:hypothetical protein
VTVDRAISAPQAVLESALKLSVIGLVVTAAVLLIAVPIAFNLAF